MKSESIIQKHIIESIDTTQLHFNTEFSTGGIVNIPFITAQANATDMESYFWLQRIKMKDGQEKMRLQYLQIVILDFFHVPMVYPAIFAGLMSASTPWKKFPNPANYINA